MAILNFQKPDKVIMIDSTESHGKFEFRPLEPGYGLTIGNALRRVLLSSLEGYAFTSIKIDGIDHEFSTVEGVVEDVTEIILNIKQIRLKRQIDDVENEKIAGQEALKVGIPVYALVKTNSNPGNLKNFVQINDDSSKTIKFVLNLLSEAILEGQDSARKQGLVQKLDGDKGPKVFSLNSSTKTVSVKAEDKPEAVVEAKAEVEEKKEEKTAAKKPAAKKATTAKKPAAKKATTAKKPAAKKADK